MCVDVIVNITHLFYDYYQSAALQQRSPLSLPAAFKDIWESNCPVSDYNILNKASVYQSLWRCRRVTSCPVAARSLPGASFLRNVCIREAPHSCRLPAARSNSDGVKEAVPALPHGLLLITGPRPSINHYLQ